MAERAGRLRRELPRIHLHSARPAGRNEPRVEGELGAQEILQRVGRLGPRDVCVCLLSGGGSALLPAPPTGLTLGDLQAITQELSAAGANIHQLNSVRKRLSLIQGGRLAQACRAGVLITFIISDVIGDPLDIIASGPTVLETDERQAAQAALHWFDHFQLDRLPCGPKVRQWLQRDLAQAESTRPATDVVNLVIGNNELATAAAARCAREMGYQVQLRRRNLRSRPPRTSGANWRSGFSARHPCARPATRRAGAGSAVGNRSCDSSVRSSAAGEAAINN